MNFSLKNALLKSSIASICLSASTAYANSSIDEIVVTAKGNQTINKSLFTTHIFTEQDIQAAQVEDVPALLDRVAGISVVDSGGRGSSTNVFVRGAASDQTIVLVDGIRVGSATSGAASLNSYPIESIQRIEVLKGPFSGIYGSDAIAGVIHIITKKGGDGKSAITAAFGSDGRQEISSSISLGNEKHSLHVGLQHENLSGFDRTDSDTSLDRDGFRENIVNINGKTTLNESTTATLSILHSQADVEIDGFGQSTSDDENLNIVLGFQSKINDKLTWNNTLGFNDNESIGNESELSEFAVDSVFSTERETFTSEINYAFNATTNITLGTDYYREDISDSNTDFTDSSRDNKGYYGQLVSANDSFNVVTSVRRDENSDYGDDTNYSIALGYRLNDQIRFSVSNGTAFNAPTFNDLFFPLFDFGFTFNGVNAFAGNADLLPEESESYEFNIIGNYDVLTWSVSRYQTDFDNLIANIANLETQTLTPANINRARIEGYEIRINTNILDWSLGLNIDVLSTQDLATRNRLPGRAEETVNFSAARDFGEFNLAFNIKFEHDRFESSNSESRLSSYTLYDIRASYNLTSDLTLSAKVENLFDKDFIVNEGFNTSGRQAKVSLRYAF